jgi:hypothetical protein
MVKSRSDWRQLDKNGCQRFDKLRKWFDRLARSCQSFWLPSRLVKRVTLEQRGKIIIKVADTARRLNFWQGKAARFPNVGKAAVRLLSMHASTAALVTMAHLADE